MKNLCKYLAIALTLFCVNLSYAGKDMQYSVQLWSVRDAVDKDFKGTLKAIADMGFDAVEFAGNYGGMENDPAALKAFLDKLGLKASAAHVRMHTYSDEEFDKWANFFKVIGCNYLINPMDDRAWNPETVAGFAKELNELSARLKPYGLRVGYHNHRQEFADYKGSTFWDFIGNNTKDDVVLQLDVGWVRMADKDAIDYVKRFKGRTITTHYKAKIPESADKSLKHLIGQDGYDWAALIKANKKYGGTLWYTVEQEDYPDGLSSLQSLELSFKGLKAVVAGM